MGYYETVLAQMREEIHKNLLAHHTAALARAKKTPQCGVLISSHDTGLSGCAVQILADFSARPKGPSRKCGTCASVRAANTRGRRKNWHAAVCAHPDSLGF